MFSRASSRARAVEHFLTELELELKRRAGVVPEDGLADALEALEKELGAMGHREDESDDELTARFATAVGLPSKLADGYEARAGDIRTRQGYAPGWRFFCPVCRRSCPAARVGMIRIGAWSWGKRMLGYCRRCRWLRWLCLVKDLDQSTLPRALLANPRVGLEARNRRRASHAG